MIPSWFQICIGRWAKEGKREKVGVHVCTSMWCTWLMKMMLSLIGVGEMHTVGMMPPSLGSWPEFSRWSCNLTAGVHCKIQQLKVFPDNHPNCCCNSCDEQKTVHICTHGHSRPGYRFTMPMQAAPVAAEMLVITASMRCPCNHSYAACECTKPCVRRSRIWHSAKMARTRRL